MGNDIIYNTKSMRKKNRSDISIQVNNSELLFK